MTKRQKRSKLQTDILRLTLRRDKMSMRIRALRKQIQALQEQKKYLALNHWHLSTLNVSLVATDEPGILHVSAALTTPEGTFNASKEFQIINVCYALPHMAPKTMEIWRDCLQTAGDILDTAIIERGS